MTSAALSIAFGRVELLVARRMPDGLEVVHRSAFRFQGELVRAGHRVLDAVRTARELGAGDVTTVVVANGRETAVAARLALAAGTEVRLLRGGDERALVFAGATLGRAAGEPVTVCSIEDGVVDVIAGCAGNAPRWAASIVAAQARSVPVAEALQRFGRLVQRLELPPGNSCLLTGSGARSLRLALAANAGLSARAIVEDVERVDVATVAHSLSVSARRAHRIVFAATLADAVTRATGAKPGFASGGLLEGALVNPSGISGRLAPKEGLDGAAELLLAAGGTR
jgi:hypothetical protein